MICPTCRGERTVRQIKIWQRQQNGGLVNCSRWESVPCPECGGCGFAACCTGDRAEPDLPTRQIGPKSPVIVAQSDLPADWQDRDAVGCYSLAIREIGGRVRAGAAVPDFMLSAQTIAALYVERGGVYWNLPNVDPWDRERDARLYNGPHPIVAHPPCERWGRFAAGSPMKRGYVIGDDEGCFEAAFRSVREYGGVLEHPAGSKAWPAFGISKPEGFGWTRSTGGGWVCEIEQGHYGHVARKKTWLYAATPARPAALIWGPSPQRLPARRLAERGYESARRCGAVANQSSRQRQRTPIPFRDVLLSIARSAR